MLYLVERPSGDERPRCYPLNRAELSLGRDPRNDIVLASTLVSERQAVIRRDEGGLRISSEGLNPIRLNGRELIAGDSAPLRAGDRLLVAGHAFEVCEEQRVQEELGLAELRRKLNDAVLAVHDELVKGLYRKLVRHEDLESSEGRWEVIERLDALIAKTDVFEEDEELARFAAGEGLRGRLVRRALRRAGSDTETGLEALEESAEEPGLEQEVERLALEAEIALGLDRPDLDLAGRLAILRDRFGAFYQGRADALPRTLQKYLARRLLRKEVVDLTFGLGPLEDLLAIPAVNEIMVVSHDQIYIETGGVLQETGRTFGTEEVSRRIIERIVSRVGRRVDQATPLVDARLRDGSRVNVVIPPIALRGCALTIRRFGAAPLTIDDLVRLGTLTKRAAGFLRACVRGRKNLIISGGTGSGKTTLLNAVSAFIDESERVVTIEDNAELRLQQEHVVALEARMSNVEGRGEITIRDLVRNALRMRPDRIIVGECRGGEAFDMLQAMNTGHDGSLTTAHANSPVDLVRRLESMVLAAVDLPVRAIRHQIAAAIDVVVQVQRVGGGRRIVTSIAEMVGLDEETGEIVLEDIFTRRPGDPELHFTGYVPSFAEELVRSGQLAIEELFA